MVLQEPVALRPSLLVVDDEVPLLQIFQEFFEGREYDLEIAHSAEEAIAFFARKTFDLVVTDLNLPGADGLSVLRAAKEKSADTEVIVLTGNASTLTAIDAMRQGAYDYVLKPFDLYEMERTIQKALERRRLLEENRSYLDSVRQANEELRKNQEALRRHRDELSAMVEQATRRMRTLYDVGKEITSSLHLEGTLKLILDRSVELIGAGRGLLYLLAEGTGQLVLEVAQRVDSSLPEHDALLAVVSEANEKVIGLKTPLVERRSALDRSLLVVPFLQEGEVTGTVAVISEEGADFTEDDRDLLVGLASQASIAIHNARVYSKIRDLDKLKSEFVAVVSHEVRTPLTAIKGTLEILSDEKYFQFSPTQCELLEICATNVSRLELLINDILDFSKLESSRLSTHFAETDLGSLIENVIVNIGGLADRKQIELVREAAPELPKVEVDEMRIIQVITNLLSNAIKFSPENSRIRIQTSGEVGMVTVRIQDSGIGIAQEDLPKLFTKFRQLDSSTTRKAGGTGLGLVISKGIVEEHGGKIWVESRAGQGSCFAFTVPIRHAVASDQPDTSARTREAA